MHIALRFFARVLQRKAYIVAEKGRNVCLTINYYSYERVYKDDPHAVGSEQVDRKIDPQIDVAHLGFGTHVIDTER